MKPKAAINITDSTGNKMSNSRNVVRSCLRVLRPVDGSTRTSHRLDGTTQICAVS